MSNLEEGLKLTTEAATDKREIQDILERLFATIDQLEAATHATGTRVEEIAGAAQAVKQSVDETGRSTDMTASAAKSLNQLVSQFTVSVA